MILLDLVIEIEKNLSEDQNLQLISTVNNHHRHESTKLTTVWQTLLIRKYINYPRYLCLSTIEPPTINEIPALAHHTSTQKIFNSATDVKLSFSVSQ
jgi:hypothetical protein